MQFLATFYNDFKVLFRSIIEVYGPLFSIKKENATQVLLLILLLASHLLQATLLVTTNTLLSQLIGVLAPELTYTVFFKCLGQYLLAVVGVGLTTFSSVFLSGKLTLHLDEMLVTHHIKRWLNTNAFLNTAIFPNKKQKILNSAVFFSHDIQKSNSLAVKSLDSFLQAAFTCFAGIYGLWQLSSSVSLALSVGTITIPAILLPLGAVIYSIVYCLIVGKIGIQLRSATKSKKELNNQLEAHSNYIDKNAEGIALLRGQEKENQDFAEILKKSGGYQNILSRLQSILSFCKVFNTYFQLPFAIIFSMPQIIMGALPLFKLHAITDFFGKVVGPFIWYGENCEDIANLSVLSERFQYIKKQTASWEEIQKDNKLNISRSRKKLILDDILIKNPNQKVTFLKQKDFQFKKAKITLIQGPSGVGKSSFFKVLAQLWPYVEGKINLPADEEETQFLPQHPFFPRVASLFDVVAYPITCQSKLQKNEAIRLIKKFKLNKLLKHAGDEKDWSRSLSGGEQQKIALIRAIWHKPKLLFMDEPFSNLDPVSKKLCEEILVEELKDTTIICIDHQADNQFYDYVVTFKNQRLRNQKNIREEINNPSPATGYPLSIKRKISC